MIKRIPSRTARSKGIKTKYVLQICLLVGVCFWLIYQVKHSHDKKVEFNKKEAEGSSEVVKHGRKDLHPRVTGLNKNEDPEDEEEEESKIGEDLEKMKLEQEREEAEMKHREKEEEEEEEELEGEAKHEQEELEVDKNEEEEREEEETKREELEEEGGDEEIDERELEKLERQADHDEDVTEEEQEKLEEGEVEEAESTEGEDKTQLDRENSMEDQNQDAGARNAHEAREVLYQADDASSAVTHDKPILSTESENVSLGHGNEDSATTDSVNVSSFTYNSMEDVNREHDNPIVQPGQNLTTEKVDNVNAASANDERLLANNDHSVPNNASTGVSSEAGKDTKGESTEMSDQSKHNEAKVVESTQAHDAAANTSTIKDSSNPQTPELKQSNSETGSDGGQTDSSSNFPDTTENAGTEGRDNSSSSARVGSDVPNTNIMPVVTAEANISSGVSSATKGAADDTHNETRQTSGESGGADEKPGSSNADGKNENEGMHNPVDTADSAVANDVKEDRLDLATLPENTLGGVNDRNAAE